MRQRELENVVSLTKKHASNKGQAKSTVNSEISRLFPQLSKNMVQALYEKYRIDFDMFDYNIDDYLKHASESQEEYLSDHSDEDDHL